MSVRCRLPSDIERLSRGTDFSLHRIPMIDFYFLHTFKYNAALALNLNCLNAKKKKKKKATKNSV